jgi:hypothetical protein
MNIFVNGSGEEYLPATFRVPDRLPTVKAIKTKSVLKGRYLPAAPVGGQVWTDSATGWRWWIRKPNLSTASTDAVSLQLFDLPDSSKTRTSRRAELSEEPPR